MRLDVTGDEKRQRDIRQFNSVSKMRDEGVDLLFLSGNSVCWVTPLRANRQAAAPEVPFCRVKRASTERGPS
jgi:hypothetical protein